MARLRARCQHRRMSRLRGSAAVLLSATLCAAPAATAASEQVSVTLAPGAGVLVSGQPEVRTSPDGLAQVALDAISVLDATGTGSGWELAAEVRNPAGENELLVRVDSRSGPAPQFLLDATPGDVVTLTAGPSL